MIYGDLSIRPLATPTNAMPSVVSFTKDCATVYVGQPVTFSVAVSDPDGTGEKSTNVLYRYQVEWFMNGYNYGINAPTYTTNDYQNAGWTNVTHTFPAAGTYTIRAEVMDEWRARSYQEMTVTVQPPLVTCAFTAPTNGAVVLEGTNLTITADAAVSYGSVSNVEFTLDGLKIATALSAPYSCVWTNAVAGAHVWTARATDGAGNVGNATAVNLSVLPITTCTITAPANGTVLQAGADLAIAATAAVLTGTVSKVEFFHDGVKIGEDLSAPYACVWSNVPMGYYALTARATQSAGRTGDAAAVYVNATASGSWEGVSATGGTVTNYTLGGTNWIAHIFTTVGSTSITFAAGGTVEYLVIGGGGGGAGGSPQLYAGGGGGAGGLITSVSGCYSGGGTPGTGSTPNSAATVTAGSYAVVVGGGGAAGGSGGVGYNGQDSVFGNTGSEFAIAKGGGGGGRNSAGYAGGSGGGGATYGNIAGGAGTANQGFAGGNSGGADSGGGGGGAGNAGLSKDNGSHGGPGLPNTITGSSVMYAGGGGGSGDPANGNGGSGGGGNYKSAGTDGKGGGGGGGRETVGGKGGSGIVIVRYVVGGGGAVALAAPTDFTATTVATNQINLVWTDNATNETGYVVDRSLDSTNWSFVTLTAANATNYSDSGRATNTLYYYRVAASNAAGRSAYGYASARTWTVYESWQRLNFDLVGLTNLAVSGATADPDHDGLNNEQEYWAGTSPTNAASCLVLYALTNNPAAPGEYVVRWQSATGRLYTVQAATNLVVGFTNLVTHRPATPPVNVHTDNVSGVGCRFYRVQVE
ncbi:MAG: Ig-like domain-containing protein [bacterium]